MTQDSFAAWPNLIAVIGGVAGSAFALLRLAMRQHQALTDRFVGFLETSLTRQEQTLGGLADSMASLDEGLRENAHLLRLMAERAGVVFRGEVDG